MLRSSLLRPCFLFCYTRTLIRMYSRGSAAMHAVDITSGRPRAVGLAVCALQRTGLEIASFPRDHSSSPGQLLSPMTNWEFNCRERVIGRRIQCYGKSDHISPNTACTATSPEHIAASFVISLGINPVWHKPGHLSIMRTPNENEVLAALLNGL